MRSEQAKREDDAVTAERLGYRPGLDGLRGVAVALVVGVHFWPGGWLPGGFVGVDLFFVLSGYLITTLLVAELDRAGEVAVGRFLWRRMVRLVPALLVLLAVVGLIGDAVSRQAIVPTFTYVANYGAAGGDNLGGLQHAWSLAVEEQFYLAWVLAVPFVWRLRRPVALLIAAAVAVALWRSWLLENATGPVWFRFDARADELLAGCALAFGLARRSWTPAPWLVALAWVAIAWCALASPSLHLLYPMMTLAGVVLVARGRVASGSAPLVWLGQRSYGIYLWHYPAYVFFEREIGVDSWRLALPVTLLAAAVSYSFVEMPLRARFAQVGRAANAPVRWVRAAPVASNIPH